MAGSDWAPIGSSGPGPRDPAPGISDRPGGDARSQPPAAAGRADPSVLDRTVHPVRRWRLTSLVAPALAILAVAGIAAAVVVDGDDGRSEADGEDPVEAAPAVEPNGSTTEADDLTPSQVFAKASRRLANAGTFAYTGTAHSDVSSLARPGIWLATEVTVEGEVVLPDRSHEVAVDATGRAVETVTEHVVIWGREAQNPENLASRGFEVVSETGGLVSAPSGATLVPDWLGSTTDRSAIGPDASGRATYRGSAPAALFGDNDGGSPFADAEVVLTVDAVGDPVRIEVTSLPGGPPLALALDISRIGEAMSIELPGGRPTSLTGDVAPEQVRAAGISNPLELANVPAEWILYDIELSERSPRPGCSTLRLAYQDSRTRDTFENYLDLDVTTPECSPGDGPFAQSITLGAFSGTASSDADGTIAQVADGQTAIEIFTDLPSADLATLFQSLEPFDPFTQPTPIDGIPSS